MPTDQQLSDFDEQVRLIASHDYHEREKAKAALLTGGKPAIGALVRGMSHPNPKMRVWCTGLLDHMESEWDELCVAAVLENLDDPVPRVRSAAVHALSCQICHPTLPNLDVVAPLLQLALHDPSIRVRRTAVGHLAILPYDPRIAEALQALLNLETDGILLSRLRRSIRRHSPPDRPANCDVS